MNSSAKSLLYVAFLFLFPLTLPAQVVQLGGPQPQVAVESPSLSVIKDTASHAENTLALIKEVIQKDPSIGPLRKRFILQRLKSPIVAQKVTDYVTANAIDQGVIDIGPPVFGSNDSVQDTDVIGVDWSSILSFIETILPIILQLMSLFSSHTPFGYPAVA